ncbi:MAG: EamA family transporter [Terriglobia bacterium]
MNLPPWFWLAIIVLVSWGVVGLLQKLSTNHLSAETAFAWLVVGFFILDPWLYSKPSFLQYSVKSLTWVLLSAFLNGLGAWALLAAMKNGGKASIVVPLTALYPIVTALLAVTTLHEIVTRAQAGGILCGLIAAGLLST